MKKLQSLVPVTQWDNSLYTYSHSNFYSVGLLPQTSCKGAVSVACTQTFSKKNMHTNQQGLVFSERYCLFVFFPLFFPFGEKLPLSHLTAASGAVSESISRKSCYYWCCEMEKVIKKKKNNTTFPRSYMCKPQYSSFLLPLHDSGGIWGPVVCWQWWCCYQGTDRRLHRTDLLLKGPHYFAKWSQISLQVALASFVLFSISLKETENIQDQCFETNFTLVTPRVGTKGKVLCCI